jgi:phage replication-related protein YjqB (UPF0714/DUF867 family)
VFADLLAEPGVEEVLELRSPRIGFMAFHGGSLERRTEVVAIEAAERAGASLYAVIQPLGLRWHIPSTSVSPDASASLRSFVDHVDVAIAIHGYGRDGLWTSLLLGGTNRALAHHVAGSLRPLLDGYEILDDLELVPKELRGLHPANPVNLPASGGVQLELPPRVRALTPHLDEQSFALLIDGLAEAAATWSA